MMMRCNQPGYVRCSKYDSASRRAIWYRTNDDGSVEVCAGREGDDNYVKLTPGVIITNEIMESIIGVFQTGEWVVSFDE